MNGLEDLQARLVEAAAWRVRLTDAGMRSSPEFEAWLRDTGNQAAWAQIAQTWNYFDGVSQAPEIIAARQATDICSEKPRSTMFFSAISSLS